MSTKREKSTEPPRREERTIRKRHRNGGQDEVVTEATFSESKSGSSWMVAMVALERERKEEKGERKKEEKSEKDKGGKRANDDFFCKRTHKKTTNVLAQAITTIVRTTGHLHLVNETAFQGLFISFLAGKLGRTPRR